MFSPVDVDTHEELPTKADRLILNWNNAHPEAPFAPLQPQPWVTIRGQKVYMTDQQYHDFQVEAGQRALATLQRTRLNVVTVNVRGTVDPRN